MIEAVNSVIANAQVDRSATAQVDPARAHAASTDKIQEVAQAPFVSPHIAIDYTHNKAVIQIRNPDTGDVLKQFPSETVLEAQLRAETNRQISSSQKSSVQTPVAETSTPSDTQAYSFKELSSSTPAPANPQAQVAAEAFVAAAQTVQSNVSSVSVTA